MARGYCWFRRSGRRGCPYQGFDHIPEVALPRLAVVAAPAVDAAQKRPHTIRRLLASRGMMEAVTFSFLDAETARKFGGGDDALTLVNAISTDLDTMRPTIMPNLLFGFDAQCCPRRS